MTQSGNGEQTPDLAEIPAVLDELAAWYVGVIRWVFYPEDSNSERGVVDPVKFDDWLLGALSRQTLDRSVLNRLKEVSEAVRKASQTLIGKAAAAGGAKPDVATYDQFCDLYEDFVVRLRRLERDILVADSGVDAETGLRSRKAMMRDLEREMERRSRRGKPFSLLLARIDGFDDVRAKGDDARRLVVGATSSALRACIRVFDDAYRYTDGVYLISLKHADSGGALSFIDRLKMALRARESLETGDLTCSYCLSEPMPGDVLPDLLRNMEGDLAKAGERRDMVFHYQEVSPLQRYVNAAQGTTTE